MRKAVLASLGIALLFGIKACGEPYEGAEGVVEEFMEEVSEGEGMEAIKFLHPTYRDNLAKDLRLPVQLTEMKPSQALACLLSTMGSNIDEVEVKDGKLIGDRTALLKVKVEDKSGIKKLFTFVLVREDGEWMIADITPYVPTPEKSED